MFSEAIQNHRLRLLFGIELASKVIQKMIKILWESPGINFPAQMHDSGRWGSQAQPHEDRDDTVRADELPWRQATLKGAHAHNQWRQTAQDIW